MGKRTNAAVIGKRINGNTHLNSGSKIMYHLQQDQQSQWLDY